MIDPITQIILEKNDIMINEGLLTTLNKVFVWMGFGKPAHPKVKAVFTAASRCSNACWTAYPDERQTSTKRREDTKEKSDQEIRKEREETIETIKENPERGKCLIMCYHDKLENLVKVIKQNRKDVCSRNMNRDLCEKWVDMYLPQMEADLKALKKAVSMMKGVKKGDTNQQKIKVVVNALQKIL